jgi:hypothetical protein
MIYSKNLAYNRPLAKLKKSLQFKITLRHIEKLFYELPRRFYFSKINENLSKSSKSENLSFATGLIGTIQKKILR